MAKWNETTARILRALTEGAKAVDDLAEILECSRANVTVPLLKLLRAGHVDRELHEDGEVTLKGGKRPVRRPHRFYLYSATDKGRKKLEILEEDAR